MNKFYTKEELLNDKNFKNAFKTLNDKFVKYDPDKKKMQRIIIKELKNFINKYEDNIFDTIGVFLNEELIEKIILYIRYNSNITSKDIIDLIKKSDELTLEKLIIDERLIIESKIFMDFEEEFVDTKLDNREILGVNKDIINQQLDIALATVNSIKAIKYNYNNTSITYFDKDNKEKKAFVKKKLSLAGDSFYFINDKQLTPVDFIEYLDMNFPDKSGFDITELPKYLNLYLEFVKMNISIIDDEYSKLILSEKYISYVSDRINSPNAVYKSPVDINAFLFRKVLLPKSGVLLLIQDNDMVESILLKEIFKYNTNNIVSITKYKDGKELVNVFTLEEYKLQNFSYWTYAKEKKTDANLAIEYIIHFLNVTNDSPSASLLNLNYEVIAPTYWKYRNRGYKSENDTLNDRGLIVKREFEIEIAPYIRKIKGEASKEAKDLARRLGVILENGYTIVKPHTRVYNSNK